MDEKPTEQSDLSLFRRQKDVFFQTSRESPLTREQKKRFTGLNYFPENPDLRFDLTVERITEEQEVEMQTSTGDVQSYLRYGRLRFTVDGQEVALTLFYDGSHFFLPFVDSLAGKETYGAGRYLDLEPLEGDRFAVDFNLAYNPYCAYNENWSCPLTPFENRLKAPIRAGEKIPEGEWVEHA